MNYLKHYIQLCKKAKNRIINEYTENHHIFPQCIYGKNKVIVKLTAKEHFIAHFLLYKLAKKRYGNEHVKTKKLGYAFYHMTISSPNQKRYTSRSYEYIKKWYSENNPSKFRNLKGENNPMFGKKGKLSPRYGIKHTSETKEKISKANKGKLLGENNPAKRDDVRIKISIKRKGKYKLKRDENPKSIIKEKQKQEILLLWKTEKHCISGYKFCRKYNQKYNVSPAAIGNIIYS